MKNFILLIIISLNFIYLKAQTPKSIIKGTITNEFKKPIEYVTVYLEGTPLYASTNKLGEFKITNVPYKNYTLSTSILGFKKANKKFLVNKKLLNIGNIKLENNSENLNEIILRGKTKRQISEESAQAIKVIETHEVKLQTSDLGAILSRVEGVNIRQTGGLGSKTNISLNGLTGNQIRYFLDGIPLHFNGYLFGLPSVPVNMVNRIEIYKGVVPLELGSDALGGAINIISPKPTEGTSGFFSYQTGSFGTHRVNGGVNYSKGKFYSNLNLFYDDVKNNYSIKVEIPNSKGKLIPTNINRFHDKYRARGGNITLGIKNTNFLDDFNIKAFYSYNSKEIQHNNIMSGIPYGEAIAYKNTYGFISKSKKRVSKNLLLKLDFGYNYSKRQFFDVSTNTYNWFGEVIDSNSIGGETLNKATNLFTYTENSFVRFNLNYKINKNNQLKFISAPTYSYRTANDLEENNYDISNAKRHLLNYVNGIEYKSSAFNKKLVNSLFLKHYLQDIISKEVAYNDERLIIKKNKNYWGYGNAVRYSFTDYLIGKTSYEYTIRLPETNELFGDGQFEQKNITLLPERSHNINLGVNLQNKPTGRNLCKLGLNTFFRKVKNMIIFIPSDDNLSSYQNVLNANSIGLEFNSSIFLIPDKFNINLNTTYQHLYNTSSKGEFKSFKGDKIPNRPYLFANLGSNYSFKNLFNEYDSLTAFLTYRFTNSFYRSWESAGVKSFKIPNQYYLNLGTTYKGYYKGSKFSITAEIQNLTNKKNYDYYGVQKPGRAFYIKINNQF